LRKQLAAARALSKEDIFKASPLSAGAGMMPLPQYFAVDRSADASPASVMAALNAEGYWPGPLGYNSHPFTRQGTSEVAPGDYSQSHVGDRTDTSPYPDEKLVGISTAAYIRNMSALIRALDADLRR
jgi:hypothetical protein